MSWARYWGRGVSKALKTVAVIAGAVALVATGVGAAAGLGAFGAVGSASATAVAATASTVATIASVASTVASIGAQLTAKKPPARGTINQVIIAAEPIAPCILGRTYSGGVLRHDVGYGAKLKKVPNPYRGMVIEYSVAGPCDGLEGMYLDYAPVPFSGDAATGYYSGFLYRSVRSGLWSETALTPHLTGMPNWTSAHKLSSKAAILWNAKFDRDGKRFASGFPASGAVWRGVRGYDARQDSTFPGGSGPQRANDETTWTYSEDPGVQAISYVLGRFRNGKKVFGVGLPMDGIIVEDFVALSNICQANGWAVGGVIYEPGDRWANLKRILEAGAAEPMWRGGRLGVRFNAPRVSVHTLTEDDLADPDVDATAMQTWGARMNGVRPKYRSEANKWEYVQSALVSIPSYVTEDGEEKIEEAQWDLVQDKDQVAQLAAYRLMNARELSPIILPCKPHMRHFGPGDMLTIDLPEHGLGGVDAVIIKRELDPASMVVTFTMMSESAGKHDFALGRTGTAPPTPALTTGEERDDVSDGVDRGADGFSIAPSSFARAISAANSGAIKAGQFPIAIELTVNQGADDLSLDPMTTFALSTSNCFAALGGSNSRTLTVNGMTADRATATVTISYDGTNVGVFTLSLTKVRDGAAAQSVTDNSLIVNDSSTYAGVSGGPLALQMTSGSANASVVLNYIATNGAAKLAGKIQYRTTPGSGSWIDMAPETQDEFGAAVGEPSTLTISQSVSSAPSTDTWEFQLLTRRYSGAGDLETVDFGSQMTVSSGA